MMSIKERRQKRIERRKMKKQSDKYIFPNFMADAMSKVDMKTQYEASMMSITLILIGLVVTAIYLFLFTNLPTWYLVFVIINVIAGFIFLTSFLITSYQQYKSYIAAKNFQKELAGGDDDGIQKEKNKTRSS